MPKIATPCRHCRRKRTNRPRGLCWTCYNDPAIREQYDRLPDQDRGGRKEAVEPPRPDRKDGEPPVRCFWCNRFRCWRPLRICGECQADYDERAATMPRRAVGEY